MGGIKALAFDKTGTLTKGSPAVTDFIPSPGTDSKQLLSAVAALENGSRHPLASAIMKKAEQEGLDYENIEVQDFASITGKGIKGKIGGETCYVGSPNLFDEVLQNGIPEELRTVILDLQNQGKTVMAAGTPAGIMGVIAVADVLRIRN
ncbi:metal cation transporter p-type ATPase, CtpV [Mycobacteroides abscessus subsp. abscessus]|nr:metal cation transporter p-type ATPase, CtpV [Mycobacteroides abscessus subsp. abscessus]